jgi:uncharacterized membrane-anchored protein YjiN (DUF445 family)
VPRVTDTDVLAPPQAAALARPDADAERRRGLVRMKTVATGFLVGATVIFLIARAMEDDAGAWVGYVRAFAEAAMVGALADWFAVTALFRHPLGIPIPHTAIIPHRKDQIGRSLGEFVQGNFLTREVLAERLRGAHVGARLGRWLAVPAHAERATEATGDALRGVLEMTDDRDVGTFIEHFVEQRVRATPVSPLAGRLLDLAIEGGHHQRLLDVTLSGLRTFLEDHRNVMRQRLDRESPWWIPEPIDDRIFRKIFTGVQTFLADVQGDPDHEFRHSLDERLSAFATRLRHDPELAAKGEELKEELLAHPDVRAWLSSIWDDLKTTLVAASEDPQSELRTRMAAGLQRFGLRLEHDAALQSKIDHWLEQVAGYVVDNYKGEVAELISSTVARWDAEATSRKLELQVGRDLQFIRINGTLVGGLAGLLIHTLSETVF